MAENRNNRRKESSASIDLQIGRVQPQALEMERAILGALMIDNYVFSQVGEQLAPEKFYDPKHQLIYEAIQTLSLEEKPIDTMTVCEQLKRMGKLIEAGNIVYLAELSESVSSSSGAEYYAKVISDKSLARQLISFAGEVSSAAFEEKQDVDELMQQTEGKLFAMAQQNTSQDYLPAGPIVREAMRVLQVAGQNADGMTGLASNFHKLDAMTSGWQNSDLAIIAGRPAMGKTAFALSIAKNIAFDNKQPVGFFSLEMSRTQLMHRLFSNICGVNGHTLLNAQLNQAEWASLDKNIREMESMPLFIDETASLSIFELRTKARRMVRKDGVKLIIIDYLQLMTASGMKFGNRQEEVSMISKSLKSLAKELNIPIIALSQLNRGVESREGAEGKRPQLSDLRESGAIEQDADIVLFVHRPAYYRIFQDEEGNDPHGLAEINIAKHRKGATGIVKLKFEGEYTKFDNEDAVRPFSSHEGGGEFISSRINTWGSNDFPPPSNESQNSDFPF